MAHIECEGVVTPERFNAELQKMDKGSLYAQQLVQQGAIHAVSYLLKIGCNSYTANQMLESLCENNRLLRAEGDRRGYRDLFPDGDQKVETEKESRASWDAVTGDHNIK